MNVLEITRQKSGDGVLTVEIVRDALGVTDVSYLTEIEFAFMPISTIPSSTLKYLPSLTSLTLIQTGLRAIPDLSLASGSLRRLSISSQSISSLDGMSEMLQLRELFLQVRRNLT